MTNIGTDTVKCSVCGQDSEQGIIISTNSFGSMDLDTRPPEMQRSTMNLWLQKCPHCGYVAGSLDEQINCDREYLSTSEYKDFPASLPVSELAQRFVKKARLAAKEGDYEAAFWAYLRGAWASDDAEDEARQIELRKSALQMMDKFIDKEDEKKNDTLRLIRVDLLRKTCQFERLLQEYENVRFETGLLNDILQFQIIKAKNQDVSTYTVEDAKIAKSGISNDVRKLRRQYKAAVEKGDNKRAKELIEEMKKAGYDYKPSDKWKIKEDKPEPEKTDRN